MYNIFLKHQNRIYCAAVRKGAHPGLCFKVDNKIYNIITMPLQTTNLMFKNTTKQSILFKTPGAFTYLDTDVKRKLISFYGGEYQKITTPYDLDYFLPTSGTYIVYWGDGYIWDPRKIKYSYNGIDFQEKTILTQTIINTIQQEILNTPDDVSWESAEDDGNGGINIAYEIKWRVTDYWWYTYAIINLKNFDDAEPEIIDIYDRSQPQHVYEKPGEQNISVNGWYRSNSTTYVNPDTQETITIPEGGKLAYDPVSQYYYLIYKTWNSSNTRFWLYLKRSKDLSNWTMVETLINEGAEGSVGIGQFKALSCSDLP